MKKAKTSFFAERLKRNSKLKKACVLLVRELTRAARFEIEAEERAERLTGKDLGVMIY